MNAKLQFKSKITADNLVILITKKDIEKLSKYINSTYINFISKGLKKDICFFTFPNNDGVINFQFFKEHKKIDTFHEEVRLKGADFLKICDNNKLKNVHIIDETKTNLAFYFAEGLVLSSYQFLKYYTNIKDKQKSLSTIEIDSESISKKLFNQLVSTTKATLKARDLVNEPLSYLTAEKFSKEIISFGEKTGYKTTVLDFKKIKSLKMGGIIAVNKGSFTPPTFNILEWKPKGAKNNKPIVLVGKGIVYDTGGLSLKPTAHSMDFMKCDMGGGATVVGVMGAISSQKLPLHVIGLIPATDNRPGNKAYVPGDVIKMYSGKTVEVLNTDAEGRLVLADALHYAKQYEPELVLDFATLTGSAVRALGMEAMALMSKTNSKITEQLLEAGRNVYERLVEFPLWEEYGEQIKSNIADIKNLGGANAGMITAGKFLEHFVDYPWMHIDIAGPAYFHKKTGYKTVEGSGIGVRLMFEFLNNYKNS